MLTAAMSMVLPTLPSITLRILTATSSGSGSCVAVAAPPANTRDESDSLRYSATSSSLAFGIPVCSSISVGEIPRVSCVSFDLTSSLRPLVRPLSSIAPIRNNAMRASEPTLDLSQRSAFAPVRERRGSTCTKRSGFSARRASAHCRAYPTGLAQVSRKSAPKLTTTWALSIAKVGTP